jgi:hypothetical protein
VMAARVTLRRHVLSLVCGVMVAPLAFGSGRCRPGLPSGAFDETPQLGGAASGWEEAELERPGSPRMISENSHRSMALYAGSVVFGEVPPNR